MKVTFGVYDHVSGSIDLVQRKLNGNKPSEAEWEQAAQEAKKVIADQANAGSEYNLSITFVLKGWVLFEDRAPTNLG
jgi:hypothetical protein